MHYQLRIEWLVFNQQNPNWGRLLASCLVMGSGKSSRAL